MVDMRDSGETQGLDEIVKRVWPNEDAVILALEDYKLYQAAADAGIPELLIDHLQDQETVAAGYLPLDRQSVIRSIQKLVSWIHGRTLIEELPKDSASVEWFECHAPPGGSVEVRRAVTQTSGIGAGIRVMGSGLKGGRQISMRREEIDPSAPLCVRYTLDLGVIPRLYEWQGQRKWTIDVVSFEGNTTQRVEACVFCGHSPDHLRDLGLVAGPHENIVAHGVGKKITDSVIWTSRQEVNLGVTMPRLPDTQLGLSVWAETQIDWSIEYLFQKDGFYQRYFSTDHGSAWGPMWAYSVTPDGP